MLAVGKGMYAEVSLSNRLIFVCFQRIGLVDSFMYVLNNPPIESLVEFETQRVHIYCKKIKK